MTDTAAIAEQLHEIHAQAEELARHADAGSAYHTDCTTNPTADALAALDEAARVLRHANRLIRKAVAKPRIKQMWQRLLTPTAEDMSNTMHNQ